MSRKFSISARHSGFMTCAERPALVLPGPDTFRLPLCFAFVMFFSFFRLRAHRPQAPHILHYLLFWCQGTGGQKNFPWPAAFVFGLAGGMVGRAVSASRPPLPTVGADHRTARRCGKTGQTGFATTHAVGPFDVWFWFDRISPLLWPLLLSV